ncbi:MAG: hypothetical protein WAL97_05225 [Halobacteriota archaeon]
MAGNDLKRLWDRFKRWYAPWEPAKRQPTSLSQKVVPPLNVIKAQMDPEERIRFKRVQCLALWRFLGLAFLWGIGVDAYLSGVITLVDLLILPCLAISAILFLWLFPRRRFFSNTSIKTGLSHVDWSKYYAIRHLAIFNKTMGLTVVVGIALMVMAWLAPGHHTSFADFFAWFAFPAGVVLVTYAVLFCAVMWRTDSLHAKLDECHEMMADVTRGASSEAASITIPTRCYKDDSHNVCVSVWPTSTDPSICVEAELQAAGMKVIGSLKQRLPLGSSKLLFFWNCNFATSGSHMVNVLVRLTNAQGEVKKELLRKTYEVHIITLYRQYGPALITTAIAAITLLLRLAGMGS